MWSCACAPAQAADRGVAGHFRFSSAMRTISSSIALSTRGRPGLRCFEPSNLRATSLRYHPRMVSGRAAVATSPSALRPSLTTNLAELRSLGVRELWPTPQLASQDLVLSGEIFIPQQQLLVHRPADVGQDTCPLHELPHLPGGSQWAPLIAAKKRSGQRVVRPCRLR